MSGNCRDGFDIQVQADLDAVVEDANACDGLPKFNLKDANGTIMFPSALSDIQWVKGTLSTNFDSLNLTDVKRVERVELMPSDSPPDEIVFGKSLVLPTVDMYEPTYATWLKVKEREDAAPLELAISQAASLENLAVETVQSAPWFYGSSSLNILAIKNSDWSTDLARIEDLRVSDMGDAMASLYGVDWIRYASFNNITTDSVGLISLQIDSDLSIRNTIDLEQPSNFFSAFTSVGRDMLIHDNDGMKGSFDGLKYAKNITVKSTIGSSLDWPALEEAVSIHMSDNSDTRLPGNMDNLEFVDDIYLNGEIMTDLGPNIFPALRRAKNSVIIEAWNKDFDCRTLVNQWDLGYINKLYCNGTNGHTNSTKASPRFGKVDLQHESVSAPVEAARHVRRDIAAVRPNGEAVIPVDDYQGIREGEDENDPWAPCTGSYGGVRGVTTVALVLGLIGLVFLGFRRRRQQQLLRQRVVVVPDEEGPELEEEKPMMAQRE